VPRFGSGDGGFESLLSRISPMRMMSGFWRSTARIARGNVGTSMPISRCSKTDLSFAANGKLDGVLNRHDMAVEVLIDPVQHGRHGRALARAGGATNQQNPVLRLGEPDQCFWINVELFETSAGLLLT